MRLIISARHFELSDNLRELVEQRLDRLARFEPKVTKAEVTLLEEKKRRAVEARLTVERSKPIHAVAEAPEFRSAIDRVVDKLSRQLRKNHGRRVERQGTPKDSFFPSEPEVDE